MPKCHRRGKGDQQNGRAECFHCNVLSIFAFGNPICAATGLPYNFKIEELSVVTRTECSQRGDTTQIDNSTHPEKSGSSVHHAREIFASRCTRPSSTRIAIPTAKPDGLALLLLSKSGQINRHQRIPAKRQALAVDMPINEIHASVVRKLDRNSVSADSELSEEVPE